MTNVGFPALCIGTGLYRHMPNSRNCTETSQWKLVEKGPPECWNCLPWKLSMMAASVWLTAQNAQPTGVCQWQLSLNCSHGHVARNAHGQPAPLTCSYAPTHCWMALLHSVSVPANSSHLGDTRFSRNTLGFKACHWTETQGPILEQVFTVKGSSQNTHR